MAGSSTAAGKQNLLVSGPQGAALRFPEHAAKSYRLRREGEAEMETPPVLPPQRALTGRLFPTGPSVLEEAPPAAHSERAA